MLISHALVKWVVQTMQEEVTLLVQCAPEYLGGVCVCVCVFAKAPKMFADSEIQILSGFYIAIIYD